MCRLALVLGTLCILLVGWLWVSGAARMHSASILLHIIARGRLCAFQSCSLECYVCCLPAESKYCYCSLSLFVSYMLLSKKKI